MKSFVLILVICALRGAQSTNNTQTAADDSNDESIYPGKYPSHVVIRQTKKEDFLVCEGVLFSKNLVLTAAGCVQKYKSSPQELQVVAGIISTENIQSDKNAQIRKVTNITIHQDWNNSKQESGDIAILKVSPSFDINKYVNVSAYGIQLFTNDSIRVVGYGDSENLISNKLKVSPAKECYYSGGSSTNSTEKFCAKINTDGYEETFWDKSFAGAPILLDDANKDLAGVMSVNRNAITYVEHYSEWIESIAGVSKTKNNRVQLNQSNSTSPSSNSTFSSNETTTTTVSPTSQPTSEQYSNASSTTASADQETTTSPTVPTTSNSTESTSTTTSTIPPITTASSGTTTTTNNPASTTNPTSTTTTTPSTTTPTTPSTTESSGTNNNSTSTTVLTSTTSPTTQSTSDEDYDDSSDDDDD